MIGISSFKVSMGASAYALGVALTGLFIVTFPLSGVFTAIAIGATSVGVSLVSYAVATNNTGGREVIPMTSRNDGFVVATDYAGGMNLRLAYAQLRAKIIGDEKIMKRLRERLKLSKKRVKTQAGPTDVLLMPMP